MNYTITIIRRDRTDVQPRTFHATRLRIMLWVLVLIVLPVVGFYVSYKFVAPFQLGADIQSLKSRTKEAEDVADAMEAQHEAIVEENSRLRDALRQEREQKAELEAKMTITETARQEVSDQFNLQEKELISLRENVKFYEQFMKPVSERAPLQCFNMKVSEAGGKVKYGVSFMKNDRKDKEKISIGIKFRVLAGNNARAINTTEADTREPDHTRKASLTLDASVSGTFTPKAKLPEGLRLLDIKGYDSQNQVIAHCWKAF